MKLKNFAIVSIIQLIILMNLLHASYRKSLFLYSIKIFSFFILFVMIINILNIILLSMKIPIRIELIDKLFKDELDEYKLSENKVVNKKYEKISCLIYRLVYILNFISFLGFIIIELLYRNTY